MDQEAMTPKRRGSRGKKPYGPNIVRAWFDTVFHYALRGLENERDLLAEQNWTFRFNKQTFDYLAPLAKHLPGGGRENLVQFVSFFPEIGASITEHDRCERQLEQDCRAYLRAILNDSNFRDVFQSVAVEAPHALGHEFSANFGAYSSEEDFMGVLAEHLINNVETLPGLYITSPLWNRYSDRFRRVVSEPEMCAFRSATAKSGKALLDAVIGLTSSLKTARSDLSLEFDVPYVAELSSVR